MNAWGSEALIYYSETVDTTDCARLTSHAEEINRADLHGELCKHVIHSYLMTEEAAGIGWVAGECCDFSEASVHACKS